MGNSLQKYERLDGTALHKFIDEAYRQIDFGFNPIMAKIPLVREYGKEIICSAHETINGGENLSFTVNFEQDSASGLGMNVGGGLGGNDLPIKESLDTIMYGIQSQLNLGHTFIEGLGVSGTFTSGVPPQSVDSHEVGESAIGILAAFISGSRIYEYNDAYQAQSNIGSFVNSYFQGLEAVENGGIMSNMTYRKAINGINSFSNQIKQVKYPADRLFNLNECNLVFATKEFSLLEGCLIDLTNNSCGNANPSNRKYRGDGLFSRKNCIPGDFYMVDSKPCCKDDRCGKNCGNSYGAIIAGDNGEFFLMREGFRRLFDKNRSNCIVDSFSSSSCSWK